MTLRDGEAIHWEVPWHRLENPASVEAELRRETPPGHALFNVPVRAIGYRQDRDDIAFALLDGSREYAVVHLTYRAETDPRWPATIILDSAAALRERVHTDHQDFAD